MILNHTTHFFRGEIEDFREIAKSFSEKNHLEVLSLPCSTGQEVYSYCAILEKMNIPHHIDGVDISEKCLEIAKK